MTTRFSLILALILAQGVCAGSWLTGSSAYQEALEALAAARWNEAETLIEAAKPADGRVAWVKHLLDERRSATEALRLPATLRRAHDAPQEVSSTAVVSHCYAYHNLYLFVRAEGMPDALQIEALDRAVSTYDLWLGQLDVPPESVRWGYAGLLHEADRAAEADAFLTRTAALGAWPLGTEGPQGSETARFGFGFQVLFAYFHAARGDYSLAVEYLAAARKLDPVEADDWVLKSDDFWRLRQQPEFQALFPGYTR